MSKIFIAFLLGWLIDSIGTEIITRKGQHNGQKDQAKTKNTETDATQRGEKVQ